MAEQESGHANEGLSGDNLLLSMGLTPQQLASLGADSRMMLMEDIILTRQRTHAALATQGATGTTGNFSSRRSKRQRGSRKEKGKEQDEQQRRSKSVKVLPTSAPGVNTLSDDATAAGEQSDGSVNSEDSEAFTGYAIHEELHIHLLTHQHAADRADAVLGRDRALQHERLRLRQRCCRVVRSEVG